MARIVFIGSLSVDRVDTLDSPALFITSKLALKSTSDSEYMVMKLNLLYWPVSNKVLSE